MTAGAAAAAAVAQAIKASGAIVHVEPNDFMSLIRRMEEPLVVAAEARVFRTSYQYITCYKGLFFYTKAPDPLHLGGKVELVRAKKIWIP